MYEIQSREFFPLNPRIEATAVRKGEIASREAGLGAIALVPPHNVVGDEKNPILNLSIPAIDIKDSYVRRMLHVVWHAQALEAMLDQYRYENKADYADKFEPVDRVNDKRFNRPVEWETVTKKKWSKRLGREVNVKEQVVKDRGYFDLPGIKKEDKKRQAALEAFVTDELEAKLAYDEVLRRYDDSWVGLATAHQQRRVDESKPVDAQM